MYMYKTSARPLSFTFITPANTKSSSSNSKIASFFPDTLLPHSPNILAANYKLHLYQVCRAKYLIQKFYHLFFLYLKNEMFTTTSVNIVYA